MVTIAESMRGMCGDGFTTFTRSEIDNHNKYASTLSDSQLSRSDTIFANSNDELLDAIPIAFEINKQDIQEKQTDNDEPKFCCCFGSIFASIRNKIMSFIVKK